MNAMVGRKHLLEGNGLKRRNSIVHARSSMSIMYGSPRHLIHLGQPCKLCAVKYAAKVYVFCFLHSSTCNFVTMRQRFFDFSSSKSLVLINNPVTVLRCLK